MTLLISVLCAVAATLVWYLSPAARTLRVSILCWLFWGASLMWLVDTVFSYAELGAASFTPTPEELLNGLFLGLSVMALALVIWLVALLIRDPKGVIRHTLTRSKD